MTVDAGESCERRTSSLQKRVAEDAPSLRSSRNQALALRVGSTPRDNSPKSSPRPQSVRSAKGSASCRSGSNSCKEALGYRWTLSQNSGINPKFHAWSQLRRHRRDQNGRRQLCDLCGELAVTDVEHYLEHCPPAAMVVRTAVKGSAWQSLRPQEMRRRFWAPSSNEDLDVAITVASALLEAAQAKAAAKQKERTKFNGQTSLRGSSVKGRASSVSAPCSPLNGRQGNVLMT